MLPPTTTAQPKRQPWKHAISTAWETVYAIRWKILRRVSVLLLLRGLAMLCALGEETWQPVCAVIAKVLEAIP